MHDLVHISILDPCEDVYLILNGKIVIKEHCLDSPYQVKIT